MNDRKDQYKNAGLNSVELRRRRELEGIQLRKQKREDVLSKRRTIDVQAVAAAETPEARANEDPSFTQDSQTDNAITNEMVEALMQEANLQLVMDCSQKIRRILSKEPQPPIDDVIKSGLIPRFVSLLDRDDCPTLQFEVAWILTNIASGTTEQTRVVVEHNAVPKFIRLLGCEDIKLCEQAVWALGNIIGDGPKFREIVVQQNFVPALLQLMTRELDLGFLRNIVWVIVNLCRNKTPPFLSEDLVRQLVPALSNSIKMTDVNILSDALWALSYITELGPNYGQILIDYNLVRQMTPFVCHSDIKIQTATIRALGSLTTGSDEQTQAVIDAGALNYLYEILSKQTERIVKDSLWFLSNITAGTPEQIQTVIDMKFIPLVIDYLDSGDFAAQTEAAWVLYNLSITGLPSQINELVQNDVIPPLCKLLTFKDRSLLQLVLDTLMAILKSYGDNAGQIAEMIESCGGLDKIEQLQEFPDQDIYDAAYKLIDNFFSDNQESEEIDLNEA